MKPNTLKSIIFLNKVHIRKYIFLLALCFLSPPLVHAQNNQGSATANASATIVSDIIGATEFKNMNMAGIQSRSQSQRLYSGSAADGSASFNIIGNSYAYSITLPVTDIKLTKKDNDDEITVGSFNITSTKSSLNVDEQIIVIGAMLNVNAFQADGIYTSKTPLTVIVNYN